MAAAVAASDFLPIHQVQRDFRFGGRDLRSLVAVEPEPEPEPHPEQPDQPSWAAGAQHPCGSREPLAAGPQPVPCATFLRAGLASDRRFPSSAGHELAAGLCALAQERARSFGQELHAPGAAVAAAQDRAGQRDVRALLQQLSGEELVQLEADGKAGAGGDRGAPAARGRRLRRLVEIARAERERAEVRLVVGVGPPCGIVFGDGAAPATASRSPPGLVTAAPVVVLGFDPSVDPREGVREGMMVAEVEGCAAYGWTSAALEVVIQRAEADQTPLKLTLSHASSWIPAWQDLRAGAAVLLQSAERCRAEVSGVEFIRVKLEQLRLKERERQEALLQLAVTRLQAMHRGRSSRHDVSFYRTRSALVALQRQHRYKVKRREREAAATLVLQSFARSFLARRTFNRKKTAAVAIQSTRRALPVRREFVQHRAAACRVQSCARGRRTRQRIAKWATAAIYIERCQRGHVARLAVTWMREQLRLLGIAATTCQTKVRGNSARRWLRRLRYATLKLQALSRGRMTRQRLAECHAAATSIQTRQRMLMARRLWHAQRGGIRTIQRYTRGWSTRKALAEELRQIKLAKILWAKMDEADVKEMVTEPTMENLERMIEFNNKFEGQLRALRSAAALNPRTLTSPRTRAREQQGFDVTFSEPGPLGLKFAPNKRTHDMEVTVVRPDTQAQKHKQLRPGLVLVSVAGSGVAGKTSGEVIDILKRGGRPLTLSFWCPPEASPTDDNSFTERVRLYEHGAVPSPPRPLSARAPITPQKLTKPALRSPPGGAQSRAATSPVAITKAVSSSPPEATGGGQPHKPWDRGTKAQPDEFYAKMQAAEAAAALKLAQKKESLRKSEEAEMTFRPKLSGRGPAPTKAAAGQQLSKYPPAAKPARPTPVVHEAHVVHEAQRQKAAASSQQILDASRLAHKKLAANGRKDPEDRAKRLTRPRPVPTRRQQGKGSRPPEPEERHPQRPRAPMPKHQAMARAAGVDAMAKIAGATHSRWKSDLT